MKKFIEEFKAFALRGNVMDMAVGVLIGSAFTGIVTALTTNCIQPILDVITGAKAYTIQEVAGFANAFVTAVINFFITALVLFVLLNPYTHVRFLPLSPIHVRRVYLFPILNLLLV